MRNCTCFEMLIFFGIASGKPVHFYNFPKDAGQRKVWVEFCKQRSLANTKSLKICSLHFKEEDFERNLKFEMGKL